MDRHAPEPWLGVHVPITDPDSGRTVGALDLTSPTAGANPLLLATRAASEIGQRLLDDASLHERLVLHRLRAGRGRDVLTLVLSSGTIAARVEPVPDNGHTIDFHLRSIFRKLGVESRVDLTRLVLLTQHPREGE